MSKIKQGIFQISSIEIKKFNFEQNPEIKKDDIDEIKCVNTIGAAAQKKDDTVNDNFLVQLDLNIKANSKDKNIYHISTTILSLIAFETKDEQNKILLNNAVAIMFSYLRPMIAQITMLSGFPPYHLQPVSFEEFEVKIINEK
ncbi:protein-export chaperone SecB [Campylobacter sp. CNRCH_2016_3089]|uniref:protein-export chaperone SecB n=1 Tax=Campylobacter TaxID=194 RepID=UPI002152FBEB|nr:MULTISPECIES: protein-export chaperone SecB [Campylobacter]MCR6520885.1 protein-export chaperone SecB [Campylobacter lari]MCV3508848.1 protein-export chaperone SecB [Campylobacter sp. CNRCH_2016_3089]